MNAKDVAELHDLTDRNCHGEAMELAARMIGAIELAEKIAQVNAQHLKDGYLTINLGYVRERLYRELMEFAKCVLTASDYKTLYKSL